MTDHYDIVEMACQPRGSISVVVTVVVTVLVVAVMTDHYDIVVTACQPRGSISPASSRTTPLNVSPLELVHQSPALSTHNSHTHIIRRHHFCSASDSAYSYTFLCSAVCLSVVCLSHSCTLLKPFHRLECHLAGALVGSKDKLCQMGGP